MLINQLSIRNGLRSFLISTTSRNKSVRFYPSCNQNLKNSSIDLENKSMGEIREELTRRGLTTESRKRSVLIKRILEDEDRRRGGSVTTAVGTDRSYNPSKRSRTTATVSDPETLISSPTPVVARVLSESDSDVTSSPSPTQQSHSSVLASPILNLRGGGHQPSNWPASIVLPITPDESPMGTAIPFIPDNYNSHLQSHCDAELSVNTPTKELSTASHPSTLPGGGPSLVVASSDSTRSITINARGLDKRDGGGDSLSSGRIDPSDGTGKGLGRKICRSVGEILENDQNQRFEFEDRELRDDERRGIYKLLGLIAGSWVFSGLFQ
ncbi:hypothetical protein BY996DRAFT_4596430 [Phakopsora pachyrhizi]|uniref:SAP domain-containing protein n=1 Tax=Phakopsora pachyrhizi TaxID=170000 RepID=A0AAV0AWJ2_PHAPC|nr:hypothetical protein BY996DRAFT_4596430 [Phakopsora pachyrhizi]CAH7674568.1 hypothetical protein PPACK8108_LOCUS9467 [Phakopsora pachyrhizi]